LEKTVLIIKPDAVRRGLIGHVIGRLERAGFKILEMRLERWNRDDAARFYAVHRGKSFYEGLLEFMISGPIVPVLLEKENAISDLRELIGETDPQAAACGTIRQEIARDVRQNSVHASDSPETAVVESEFFFG